MKDTDKTLQNLLDKSFSEFNLIQGSLVKASVIEIGKKWVTLDIGFKSDGLVSIEEFQDHASKLVVEVGDEGDESGAYALGVRQLAHGRRARCSFLSR